MVLGVHLQPTESQDLDQDNKSKISPVCTDLQDMTIGCITVPMCQGDIQPQEYFTIGDQGMVPTK